DGLFGRLAVHRRLITLEQLATATAMAAQRPDTRLKDLLVELGFVDIGDALQLERDHAQILQRRAEADADRVDEPSVVRMNPLLAGTSPREASRALSINIEIDDDIVAAATAGALETTAGNASASTEESARDVAQRWLHELLRGAAREGASDIHIHANEPVRLRRFGHLWPVSDRPLPAALTDLALRTLLDDEGAVRLEYDGHVEGALSLPGVGRFRFSLYRQLGGTDAVLRVVKFRPPTLESLSLPSSLARLTAFQQGIVLITGPAASGKSSTMAALVHMINEERTEHVVTIEDPIEIVHRSIRCVVNQRQAGRDTSSFQRALRAALREDPDVIVIGEMRDKETAQLALTAAETGHLVLATLNTHSAVRTINRVIGEFPPAQQPNVRSMLSESLRAVISQRLVPRADFSGVAPALEVLQVTPAVANLIRESRTHQIRSAMQTGAAHGMQTLDASLIELVNNGVITAEIARDYAEDPRSIVTPGTPSH
ncbi:MAG TPA: PilT/PilU family type 4a pilus ATPase, partial [Myxococcota bacterium]